MYVVDSSDNVRIDEAKFELHDLLLSRDLRRVPLVVVANKQDADGLFTFEYNISYSFTDEVLRFFF